MMEYGDIEFRKPEEIIEVLPSPERILQIRALIKNHASKPD